MNVNTHVCGPTLVLASSNTGLMPVLRRELGPLRGVRMAFIPTASTVEPYGVLVRLMRIRFALAGLRVQMVDPERMAAAQVCARLQSSDIIYVGGGNTFHLMHHLHASGADDVIRKLVREGVPYVGESAGAVVASDDISYIAPMDENRGHTHMRGLALTRFHVIPHVGSVSMGSSARRIVAMHAGQQDYVPLFNGQALVVRGHVARIAAMPLVEQFRRLRNACRECMHSAGKMHVH
ncbi:peptidase [Bifidobacterium animalis subsp. animalis MCC 0483]|uniref:Peptidase n=1 Tax=Bifidobacterium animalis subsp. animalis MCC 0483 TaxID=1365955 RepID=A0AB34TBF2_9BIFI|nr:Type 1 glutamine amidotransferase-like domain-containing protein [Bifidobacterium animalis]KOA52464.1 peptidase [Bifidobacterium animalis subsp. animalis MCC 0483]